MIDDVIENIYKDILQTYSYKALDTYTDTSELMKFDDVDILITDFPKLLVIRDVLFNHLKYLLSKKNNI